MSAKKVKVHSVGVRRICHYGYKIRSVITKPSVHTHTHTQILIIVSVPSLYESLVVGGACAKAYLPSLSVSL